ncbi:hypothetical protein AAVH_28878, partial [Aphelenchoides avenae]
QLQMGLHGPQQPDQGVLCTRAITISVESTGFDATVRDTTKYHTRNSTGPAKTIKATRFVAGASPSELYCGYFSDKSTFPATAMSSVASRAKSGFSSPCTTIASTLWHRSSTSNTFADILSDPMAWLGP